jgi:hypothetical protein
MWDEASSKKEKDGRARVSWLRDTCSLTSPLSPLCLRAARSLRRSSSMLGAKCSSPLPPKPGDEVHRSAPPPGEAFPTQGPSSPTREPCALVEPPPPGAAPASTTISSSVPEPSPPGDKVAVAGRLTTPRVPTATDPWGRLECARRHSRLSRRRLGTSGTTPRRRVGTVHHLPGPRAGRRGRVAAASVRAPVPWMHR